MRGIFWLLVIALIVGGPMLVVQFNVIPKAVTVGEETANVVNAKTQEIMATRSARKEIEDRAKDAGAGIRSETPIAEIELKIHAGINAERLHGGEPSLKWDAGLASVARAHSDDMAGRGYYDHISPEGFGPTNRLNQAGLSCRRATHYGIAENIHIELSDGWGSPNTKAIAANAVRRWVESPGHRQNLMDGKFSITGVGASFGTWKNGKAVFLTQVFC